MEWFWPTAQHRPPSSPLVSPLYISLPFTFCWAKPYIPPWLTKTQGPGRVVEPWDWSLGEWGPSHSDGLHKLFLERTREGKVTTLSHGSLLMFQIPYATTMCRGRTQCSARSCFQMAEPIFGEIWLRACFHMLCSGWEIFLPIWRVSHSERDCYHIQIFSEPKKLLRVVTNKDKRTRRTFNRLFLVCYEKTGIFGEQN